MREGNRKVESKARTLERIRREHDIRMGMVDRFVPLSSTFSPLGSICYLCGQRESGPANAYPGMVRPLLVNSNTAGQRNALVQLDNAILKSRRLRNIRDLTVESDRLSAVATSMYGSS